MSTAETSATNSLSNDSDAVVNVEASKSTSLTKRAKTTRACDECRKRKVTCHVSVQTDFQSPLC
jgi:hypothetical protein